MVNVCLKFFLQIKKLFFSKIRAFKHGLLHSYPISLQCLYHPVTGAVIADIIADNIDHISEQRQKEDMAHRLVASFQVTGGIDCA